MYWFKKYTIDPASKKMVEVVFMNDPLVFLTNKTINMIEDGLFSYPAAEDLKKYNIKVINFGEVKVGDYFITRQGYISKHPADGVVGASVWAGRRFIIDKA